MKKMALSIILVFLCIMAYSIQAPVKFGKIDMADLEMTVYEPDTSASAVVLCKYGYFSSTDYTFKQVIRVKILKKTGTELSEFTFPGPEDMMVRGRVYNLENGKIVTTKVKNESVFKVRVIDDLYNIKVALPNVRVGSVYDIETSQSWLPEEFTFQREIPVKYCELVLEQTNYVSYRKRMVGYEDIKNMGNNRFVAENVPAFKEEPFMDSKSNYIAKFEFDLLNISVPGFYRNYSTSWEAVNKRLRNSTYFGGVITRNSGFLKNIAEEIDQNYIEPKDKMKAAYEAVKQVKWDGNESLLSTQEALNGVFKEKKGNSADINMLLYQLMKKLNLNCYVVALSTRNNGQLNRFYPSINKLNYMIVGVHIGDDDYLLDGTEEFLPAGMLPKRCLNNAGRLIDNGEGKWISLQASQSDKDSYTYSIKLFDDLHAEGKMRCIKSGYAAFNFRKVYTKYSTDDEYLQGVEGDFPGMRIKKFESTGIDSLYEPVQLIYDFKINNYTQQVGDLVMIDPLKYNKMETNPFLLDDRKYPVDFGYKKDEVVMTTIQIPDDYEVNSLPKPIHITLPEKKGEVLISYSTIGKNISVMYRLRLNNAVYTAEEYAYLKQLYALTIEKQAENIIIKKQELNEASL